MDTYQVGFSESRASTLPRSQSRATPPLTVDALFRDYSADVYRIVGRLLGQGATPADVQDVTQDVFLAAHRSLDRFRGESKPLTWLYGVASHVVLNYLRSRRRHARLVAALETEHRRPSAEDPHREIENRDQLRQVWRCLMDLSPDKRMLFVLHEVEELSHRDIAHMMGIKENTVRTRLFRARRALLRAWKKRQRNESVP